MKATLPQRWVKALGVFAVLLTLSAVSMAQPVVSPTAPAVCSGSTIRLTATSTPPAGFYYAWYNDAALTNLLSVGSTYTTSALNAATILYVAEVNGTPPTAATRRTAVNVAVNAVPAAPTVAATAACYGSPATITATAPAGATVNWYLAPGASATVVGSNTYTTPALRQPETYYAKSILNGCASPARTVTVAINQLPAAPASANQTVCVGSTASFTAAGANALTQWTYTPTGGAAVNGTGTSFTTAALTAGVTNVKINNVSAAGCKSATTNVYATARAIPAAITVAAATACKGTATTLTAVGGTNATEWHAGSVTGAIVATGARFTTPNLNSTTTYVAVASNNGCIGNNVSATVTVVEAAAPTATDANVCSGSSTAITATPAAGGTIAWFSDLNGGSRIANGGTYNTPKLTQNTTFYAQQTLNGCISPMTEVSVTVTSLPAAPLFITNPTICGGESTTLRLANGSSLTEWFDMANDNGATPLTIGSSFNTGALASSKTYFVRNVAANSGCKSDMASQVVTVNRAPVVGAGANQTIQYGEQAQLNAVGGLLYSWSPAKLVSNPYIYNPTTSGRLPVGQTVYTVVATDANGCTGSDIVTISVTSDPIQNAFPNVITPNGDGVNDQLLLPFLEKITTPYTFRIYARAGNVVLDTKNYTQNWDAKDLPTDTYWYVLTMEGDAKDYRGFITVRR